MNIEAVKAAIRDVPDFPIPGILFKDVTPIMADPALFGAVIELFAERHRRTAIRKVAAIEARGFIFGAALAQRLKVGFVPIRKQGKLPYRTFEQSYDLEYGSATLAIHQDAFIPGENVLLLDDLLATGGTARASVQLIEQAGGQVAEIDFVVELSFLNGRAKLAGHSVFAPIVF